MNELLCIRDVSRKTSLSRVSIYRRMADSGFPRPVRVSPGRVAWRSDQVQAWIDSRPSADAPLDDRFPKRELAER